MAGSHLSKEFFDLVKSIGESKSKQEEDRVIVHEVGTLKERMKKPQPKRMKEFLVRLMYVEMLGHDASFGYIRAVELSASTNLLDKRVGYLCAGLCFSPDNEFRIMLVNRLQKDLQSSNVLECCAALHATCKLITEDMIPAVLPLIVKLTSHDKEIVRKKAVMALHRFHQLQPSSVGHLMDLFRRALCDKDPSVMAASLHVQHDIARRDPMEFKNLVSSYVSILKQITEHRLPRDFDYHRMPAPWIQMRILRILAILGASDQKASEGMYEILLDVMRRADTGINVGYAIIYESVKTVTQIYPNATLLEAAASSIGRFLASDNHNLRYLGVTGLAEIVKDHPKYAADFQMAVIECLEDPDETLQRKTLDLLFRMTNPVNVEVVIEKLLTHLKGAVDVFLRQDLVVRIAQAAERFAPSNMWYVKTMTTLFETAGDLVGQQVASNVMSLIAEGGEDEDEDAELRQEVVETYLKLLGKPALSEVLQATVYWVLGEYAFTATSKSLPDITRLIAAEAARPDVSTSIRRYALSATMKLTAQMGAVLPEVAAVIDKYVSSRDSDVAQCCHEFRSLALDLPIMREVLPVDASMEDITVDPNLSFLDGFVAEALSAGAKPYSKPASETDDTLDDGAAGGLRFDAYDTPETNFTTAVPNEVAGDGAGESEEAAGDSGLNLSGIKSVWGEGGFAGMGAKGAGTGLGTATPEKDAGAPRLPPWQRRKEESSPAPAPAAGPWSAPAAEPEPELVEVEVEPTEKEKMAAALFGGIATPTKTTRKVSSKRAGFMRKTPTAASSPAPTPAPAPAPVPAPAPAPVPADDGDDLLGLSFGSPTPAPVPAPAPAPGGFGLGSGGGGGGGGGDSGLGGLEDLFGEPAASPAPASSLGGLMGPLGGGPDLAPAGTPVPALVLPRSANGGPEEMWVSANPAIRVGGKRVWEDDCWLLLVSILNPRPTPLSNVVVRYDQAPCLETAISAQGSWTASAPNVVKTGSLVGSLALAIRCKLCSAPVAAMTKLTVSADGIGSETVDLAFTPKDLMRPAAMTTADFGKKWVSMNENVITVPRGSITSPDMLMNRLKINLQLHRIEVIAKTSEVIASGVLMGTPETLLVHAQIVGPNLSVRVRTNDVGYTSAASKWVTDALK